MYHCPYCKVPLPRLAVLTAGSANPKACSACGGKYFAGGLPGFMAVLCAAFVVATVVAALSPEPAAAHAITYIAAFALGTWHILPPGHRPQGHLVIMLIVIVPFMIVHRFPFPPEKVNA